MSTYLYDCPGLTTHLFLNVKLRDVHLRKDEFLCQEVYLEDLVSSIDSAANGDWCNIGLLCLQLYTTKT